MFTFGVTIVAVGVGMVGLGFLELAVIRWLDRRKAQREAELSQRWTLVADPLCSRGWDRV